MKKLNIQLVVILAIVGGVLLYFSAADYFTSLKKPVDFTEASVEEIKPGIRAEGEAYAILDYFAEEETWTEKKDGTKTAKKKAHRYYIIPVGDEEYMAMEAPSSDFTLCEAIVDETQDYILGDGTTLGSQTYPFVGTVIGLDDELMGYFRDWFVETEFFGTANETEITPYLLPYMLVKRSFLNITILFYAGVAVILADVIYLILFLAKRNKDKVAQSMDMNA